MMKSWNYTNVDQNDPTPIDEGAYFLIHHQDSLKWMENVTCQLVKMKHYALVKICKNEVFVEFG